MKAVQRQTIRRLINGYHTLPVATDVRGGWKPAQHGTRSLYVRGCRCDDCRDAEAIYNRKRAERRRAS